MSLGGTSLDNFLDLSVGSESASRLLLAPVFCAHNLASHTLVGPVTNSAH